MNAILDLHSQIHKLSFTQLKAPIANLANLTSMVEGDQCELPTVEISYLCSMEGDGHASQTKHWPRSPSTTSSSSPITFISQPDSTSTDLKMNDLHLNAEGTWAWWVFLKINNDSEWSEYIVTARLGNYQEVVGLLVHMFRAAATMSPAQSEGTSVQTHPKEASAESYMGFDEEAVEDSAEEEV
ncbi:hypothetical protein PENFLA_c001G00717 [Penicillium flavigenum]|uniref:Uncharacterized protein n=1 Tax=Penicillium flavigenum TaxID=254877 RepID=A0A1V6U1R8_9EURO|nr:hypothetical protein PENFLA_c001G00717 [Penicillium flavigenum]